MNAMCGISPPLQGLGLFASQTQGVALGFNRPRRWRFDRVAAPRRGVVIGCDTQRVWRFDLCDRIDRTSLFFRTNGANYRSPGQRPGYRIAPQAQSPVGAT